MSDIKRAVQLLQPAPVTIAMPKLKYGWRHPSDFFADGQLIVPNNGRALFTWHQAMRRYDHYTANPSDTNSTAYKYACVTHNLLICDRKFYINVDNSCCSRKPPGPPGPASWGKMCPTSCENKRPRHLLKIVNEFNPEITPLVPNGDPDPYIRYQPVLALLSQSRDQSAHPGDHEEIDPEIQRFCRLATQHTYAEPFPTKGGLV